MNEYEAMEQIAEIDCRSFKADRMAHRLAIKALKKQIPQKPIIGDDEIDEFGDIISCLWQCSNCGKELDCEDSYCADCGQRIDWSDVE